MSISETMTNVLSTCDIKLDNQIISREQLIQTFAEFLNRTITNKTHNVGMVLHTGSVCFDVIAVTYAALLNLLSNQTDVNEIIKSLQIGDTVLYGTKKKERHIFDGFIEGKELDKRFTGTLFAVLNQKNGNKTYVPEKAWRLIEPYYGDSKLLDGRGIRKKNTSRDDFYIDVLGYKREDIPSVIDTSCVIVISRERADVLIKGISIQFNDKEINLLDLVTASYFTEEDEYRYGGNTGKNEPILKFTSKVSVARSLIVAKDGNKHLGLLILGNEIIQRGLSEIPEMMKRKSLGYVYLCAALDALNDKGIVDDDIDLDMFACTKDFLLEYSSIEPICDNDLTIELNEQTRIVIEKECDVKLIENAPISVDEYKMFRRNMIGLKRLEFSSYEKDSFIVQSYSLLNLFITAPFPLEKLNAAKLEGLVEVDVPETKIENLYRSIEYFPSGAIGFANEIILCLENMYVKLKEKNEKYIWLKSFLNEFCNEKIAIVVPKAYYITVIKNMKLFSYYLLRNVDFYTPGRFESSKQYSFIVVLGDYDGKKFNVFKCNSSLNLISTLYECESKSYYFKEKSVHNDIAGFQRKSTIPISRSTEEIQVISDEEKENEIQDNELEEFITNLSVNMYQTYSGYRSGGTASVGLPAEIVAVASFGEETKAFFSKRYKGYVLDEATGVVKEVSSMEFCEGDSIVFTNNNGDTKDIVNAVLRQLLDNDKLDEASKENYRLANLWKEGLRDYMNVNGYSESQIVNLLLEDGLTVLGPTVLQWLDEDSHTVGPRSVESLRHIGNITGIAVLKNNPDCVFEACREIRSIRKKILNQIGMAIVDKLSGKAPKSGTEFIYERVDKLATILQIENIVFVETTVPVNLANRPILMQ